MRGPCSIINCLLFIKFEILFGIVYKLAESLHCMNILMALLFPIIILHDFIFWSHPLLDNILMKYDLLFNLEQVAYFCMSRIDFLFF
jgi:hypothetical protein